MPLHLDDVDRRLLSLLIQDGRISFRRLARSLGVSTPTAKARYDRLVRLGLIKGVSALIDASMLNCVSALLYIKAMDVQGAVSRMREVGMGEIGTILLTSGDANIVLRVTLDDVESLERLRERLSSIPGLQVISSQIITRVIKEEQVIPSRLVLTRLECDYCRGSIAGEPIVLEGRYHFCCTSCLRLFKEKV
ncbi:MAG: AsnC family transcriptional regulator [Candidatus Nitrosocaldus sp.]|nr:AsnC family transcriptional regulator [Candidatus Nitrosocaldus sp.]MCS7140851.1 AsnC family transcriptional regulator [Candidatus Nitrosocaldus sp.]MDW7999779.1 AsnC family transcriptional regulator [Candidatus Nitrosocaldus sp.]MDW8274860.1 AsnC family transcriptional regulator [Candidatus Nitrosocaldus sp.]